MRPDGPNLQHPLFLVYATPRFASNNSWQRDSHASKSGSGKGRILFLDTKIRQVSSGPYNILLGRLNRAVLHFRSLFQVVRFLEDVLETVVPPFFESRHETRQ